MKNTLKVLGIIALVAVIGFGVMGCSNGDDDDDNNGKKPSGGGGGGGGLTLKNRPATGAVYVYGYKEKTIATLADFTGIGDISGCDVIGSVFGGGAVVELSNNDDAYKKYTGSNKLLILISYGDGWLFANDVQFTSGSAEVDWNTLTNPTTLPAGSGAGGGGGQLPDGAVTGITVDSALVGTWTGDAANGTLVFNATGVGTSSGLTTAAGAFVMAMGQMKLAYATGTIAISGGKVAITAFGTETTIYTYTASGTTLTIKDAEGENTEFTGTK
jgi:hypothetical protein